MDSILSERYFEQNGQRKCERTCLVESGSYLYPGATAHLYNGQSAVITDVRRTMGGTFIVLDGIGQVEKDALRAWTFIDDDPDGPRFFGYGEDSGDNVRQNNADWLTNSTVADGPMIDGGAAREAGWGVLHS